MPSALSGFSATASSLSRMPVLSLIFIGEAIDMRKRLKIKARVGELTFSCNGREAETLLKLIEVGPRGITPMDSHRSGPPFRLAAYVHDLKRMGVPIDCVLEAHAGGRHGRYRLTGNVVIMERNDADQHKEAA
jgi:hypothetical protein